MKPRWDACLVLATILATGFAVERAASGDPAAEAPCAITSLAWMAGSWAGEHDGGVIEEHWMAPAGNSMSGMTRLVAEGRTGFFEFLRIRTNKDGVVEYLAQPVGRCPPVAFALTRCGPGLAVFENPQHDDPKLIRYELTDDGALVATTEGDDGKGGTRSHQTRMTRSTLVP
jgi:hypothetical protein